MFTSTPDFVSDNNGGSNGWWNYSNPTRDDYSPTLSGVVVQIDNVLSTWKGQFSGVFEKKKPEQKYWYPKLSWQLTVLTDDGEELKFSVEHHKGPWKDLWNSAIYAFKAPKPASDYDMRKGLPECLGGAHITVNVKRKSDSDKTWVWEGSIDAIDAGEFRGFFEPYKEDTRWTESQWYQENLVAAGLAASQKQQAEDAIEHLKQTNPVLADSISRAYSAGAAAAYADSDIPF